MHSSFNDIHVYFLGICDLFFRYKSLKWEYTFGKTEIYLPNCPTIYIVNIRYDLKLSHYTGQTLIFVESFFGSLGACFVVHSNYIASIKV